MSPRRQILTLVLLGVSTFIFATATMMQAIHVYALFSGRISPPHFSNQQFASISEFFLHRQCVLRGLKSCEASSSSQKNSNNNLFGPSHSPLCLNSSKNATDNNNQEKKLQQEAANFFAIWALVANLCAFVACPLVGAIGDGCGRKAGLMVPVVGFVSDSICAPSATRTFLADIFVLFDIVAVAKCSIRTGPNDHSRCTVFNNNRLLNCVWRRAVCIHSSRICERGNCAARHPLPAHEHRQMHHQSQQADIYKDDSVKVYFCASTCTNDIDANAARDRCFCIYRATGEGARVRHGGVWPVARANGWTLRYRLPCCPVRQSREWSMHV